MLATDVIHAKGVIKTHDNTTKQLKQWKDEGWMAF